MPKRECAHHWVIEAPDGQPEVGARCRKCKARREFETAWPEERHSAWREPRTAGPDSG